MYGGQKFASPGLFPWELESNTNLMLRALIATEFLTTALYILYIYFLPSPFQIHFQCVALLNEVYTKWAGHLTARSDVYSFGVVLLELLTGRRSVDKTRPSKEQNLVDWARPKLNDKRKLLQIIDPRLENQYSVRAAQKACSLAYYCLSQNPKARPLMSDVVETLEPLQGSNDANKVSSSLSIGNAGPFGRIPDYRMHQRFTHNVGPGSSCRSPNPNCSPGGPAACRVRWEMSDSYVYMFGVCFFSHPFFEMEEFAC